MHKTSPCVSDQVSPKQSLRWDSGDHDSLTADLRTGARGMDGAGKRLSTDRVSAGPGFRLIPWGALEHELHQSPSPDPRDGKGTPVSHGLQGCPGWWRRAHYLSSKSALGKRSEVRHPSRCEHRALALWRDLVRNQQYPLHSVWNIF